MIGQEKNDLALSNAIFHQKSFELTGYRRSYVPPQLKVNGLSKSCTETIDHKPAPISHKFIIIVIS